MPGQNLFQFMSFIFLDGSYSFDQIAAIIFGVLVLIAMLLGIASIFRKFFLKISDLSEKYNNLERLLVDIRDNTKRFYSEKRKHPRVSGGITAKIVGDSNVFDVIDISYEGALLRTQRKFRMGEEMDLHVYLPLFPRPIDCKAKVMRVLNAETDEEGFFDIGLEFLSISPADRDKLKESIRILLKKSQEE